MKPTNFRKPRTGDRLLRIRYRNNHVDDRPRTAAQMIWEDRGFDFDIIAVEYWEAKEKRK